MLYNSGKRWDEELQDHLYQCPSVLVKFFGSLIKPINSPSHFAPFITHGILSGIVERRTILRYDLAFIGENAPILYPVILFMASLVITTTKFDHMLLLLNFILLKSKSCYITKNNKYVSNITSCEPNPIILDNKLAKEELSETGMFFPFRRYVRKVGSIKVSNSTKTYCHKSYTETSKFGAGTVLYWCAEHRCCLGFTILQSAESCHTIYTTLTTRYYLLINYLDLKLFQDISFMITLVIYTSIS